MKRLLLLTVISLSFSTRAFVHIQSTETQYFIDQTLSFTQQFLGGDCQQKTPATDPRNIVQKMTGDEAYSFSCQGEISYQLEIIINKASSEYYELASLKIKEIESQLAKPQVVMSLNNTLKEMNVHCQHDKTSYAGKDYQIGEYVSKTFFFGGPCYQKERPAGRIFLAYDSLDEKASLRSLHWLLTMW